MTVEKQIDELVKKTADFIQNELTKIGLTPLDGDDTIRLCFLIRKELDKLNANL